MNDSKIQLDKVEDHKYLGQELIYNNSWQLRDSHYNRIKYLTIKNFNYEKVHCFITGSPGLLFL